MLDLWDTFMVWIPSKSPHWLCYIQVIDIMVHWVWMHGKLLYFLNTPDFLIHKYFLKENKELTSVHHQTKNRKKKMSKMKEMKKIPKTKTRMKQKASLSRILMMKEVEKKEFCSLYSTFNFIYERRSFSYI